MLPRIYAGGRESSSAPPDAVSDEIELSVVMPCLNEAETLAVCIEKVQQALQKAGIVGEVIVADNGSTDGSPFIAHQLGAHVVPVSEKGYGAALQGGIQAARGRYILMGDADDSYDFGGLETFVKKLREGHDLVMGNRFRGGILPGAMPPLHRYLGNPVLTGIGRLLFGSPCGDFHCGLRGFRKDAINGLDLQTTGMEFASEMVVKASLHKLRIAEVPTTLAPDGRSRPPHLRSWRDGWRHLKFLLLHSPRWLFLYPGLVLTLIGLAVGAWLLPGPRTVGSVTFDVDTLLYAALAVLLGVQTATFAVFAKLFAIGEGLLPADGRLARWSRHITLETGLIAGLVLLLIGLADSVLALHTWGAQSFGGLDPARSLRLVIPAVTAMALGGHTILSSFFLSVLRLKPSGNTREGGPYGSRP